VSALAADPSRWRYGYDLSTEAGITAGTMYPALARLADDGLLEHRWELPSESGRPRHMYRLTSAGVEFARARINAARTPAPRGKPRLAPS
jgi:DNA-binding PadR family transcriptional regulator